MVLEPQHFDLQTHVRMTLFPLCTMLVHVMGLQQLVHGQRLGFLLVVQYIVNIGPIKEGLQVPPCYGPGEPPCTQPQ